MTFDPDKHHRRSIRLRDYDYAYPGAYFITICTKDRETLFGRVTAGQMCPNEYGRIVTKCWDGLSDHYPRVILDAFVVMPNHVHGIIALTDDNAPLVGAGLRPALVSDVPPGWADFKPAPTKEHGLPEIVRGFKAFSSRLVNKTRETPGVPVWQRSYYERVIRNESELDAVRHYIIHNPAAWHHDPDNPDNLRR